MGPRHFVAVLVVATAVCGWSAPRQGREFSEEDLKALDRLREMTDEEWEVWKKEHTRPRSGSEADSSQVDKPQELGGVVVFLVLLFAVLVVGGLIKGVAIQRRERELYRHRSPHSEHTLAKKEDPLGWPEEDDE